MSWDISIPKGHYNWEWPWTLLIKHHQGDCQGLAEVPHPLVQLDLDPHHPVLMAAHRITATVCWKFWHNESSFITVPYLKKSCLFFKSFWNNSKIWMLLILKTKIYSAIKTTKEPAENSAWRVREAFIGYAVFELSLKGMSLRGFRWVREKIVTGGRRTGEKAQRYSSLLKRENQRKETCLDHSLSSFLSPFCLSLIPLITCQKHICMCVSSFHRLFQAEAQTRSVVLHVPGSLSER